MVTGEHMSAQPDLNRIREGILYIAHNTPIPDKFHVVKLLYYADRFHLENYGKLIFGDRFIAMKDGPVPSLAYDLIKFVEGKNQYSCFDDEITNDFKINGYDLIPLREVHTNYLSQSNIESMDEAISRFGNMTFDELSTYSHDEAYGSADRDNEIPIIEIIKILDNPEELLDYYYDC